MKVSLLAVVTLTIVALCSAADPECLYRKIRGLSAHWPNPSDCGRFYRCSNKGIKRETVCAADKEYSAKSGKCVNIGRGTCSKLSLATPLVNSTNPCANEVTGSYIPQTGQCRNFYICNNQQAYPQTCNAGSYFNETTANCSPDKESTCWQNSCIGQPSGSYLPDTTSCSSFLVCNNNETVKQSCGAGSYFDTTESNCQPDTNLQCADNLCVNQTNGAFVKNVDDCHSYYICDCEKAVKQECPSDSYFDWTDLNCQPGECPSDETTEDCNEDTTTSETITVAPEDCTCPGGVPEGNFEPNPVNCMLFYICEGGKFVPSSCEAGNYFDPEKKVCLPDTTGICPQCQGDNAAAVVVEQRAIAPELIEDNSGTALMRLARDASDLQDCTCPGGYEPGEILPNPVDCDKYYVCADGQLQSQECGKGNLFDNCTNTCVPDTDNTCWPEDTGCGGTPGDICQGQTNGALLPDSSQCNAYYLCENGVASAQTCPGGQWFNPTMGSCTPDLYAECLNPCSGVQGIVFLPHATDCSKFYFCNNQQTHVEDCPAGTGFDVDVGICTTDAECEANLCKNQEDGVTFPVAGDNMKFYYCLSGVAVLDNCPEDTTFSEQYGVCIPAPTTDCDQTKCQANSDQDPFATVSNSTTQFCYCRGGIAYKESCQADYVFDAARGVCYSNAPCDPSLCEESPEYTITANRKDENSFCLCVSDVPVVVDCPNKGTFVPTAGTQGLCEKPPVQDPNCQVNYCLTQPDYTIFGALNNNISGFCICENKGSVYVPCTSGYTFNITLGICQPADINEPCSASRCAQEGPIFAANNAPDSFCYCEADGSVVQLDCPANTVFSPSRLVCIADNCDSSNCKNPAYDGLPFPAKNFPNGFCLCDGDEANLIPCGAGETFDTVHGVCRPTVDSECNILLCRDANSTNQYTIPIEDDPTGFCYCANSNNVIKYSCPPQTLYDAQVGVCLAPDEIPGGETACSCPGGDKHGTVVANPRNCQYYYTCVNGVWQAGDCAVGNYFNPTTNNCAVDTTGSCAATVPCATSCVGGYREGDYIAHPANNRVFYVCMNAQLIEEQCAPNSVFDAGYGACVATNAQKSYYYMRSGDIEAAPAMENVRAFKLLTTFFKKLTQAF